MSDKPMSAEEFYRAIWSASTPDARQIIEQRDAAIRANAVAVERERCAVVAEDYADQAFRSGRSLEIPMTAACSYIANVIRNAPECKLGGVSDLAIAADEQKGDGLTPEEIEEKWHEEQANDY